MRGDDKMERRLTCVKGEWRKTENGMRENNRKKAEKELKSNF